MLSYHCTTLRALADRSKICTVAVAVALIIIIIEVVEVLGILVSNLNQ
jgi:hypothetical protein